MSEVQGIEVIPTACTKSCIESVLIVRSPAPRKVVVPGVRSIGVAVEALRSAESEAVVCTQHIAQIEKRAVLFPYLLGDVDGGIRLVWCRVVRICQIRRERVARVGVSLVGMQLPA